MKVNWIWCAYSFSCSLWHLHQRSFRVRIHLSCDLFGSQPSKLRCRGLAKDTVHGSQSSNVLQKTRSHFRKPFHAKDEDFAQTLAPDGHVSDKAESLCVCVCDRRAVLLANYYTRWSTEVAAEAFYVLKGVASTTQPGASAEARSYRAHLELSGFSGPPHTLFL